MNRRKTKEIKVGEIKIGGKNPIVIQSMTNTKTADVNSTVRQITKLKEVGCQIVRLAVPDVASAKAISEIKRLTNIPLVADIHFDHKLALLAIENGVDKVRINPGNIGKKEYVTAVVEKAKDGSIPIRIGVNSGSLPQDLSVRDDISTAEKMVRAALREVEILEKLDFNDICISLKSSDVVTTIEAYTKISEKLDYPLHLGVTEAGLLQAGTVKSALGIGTLLYKGIGDTIRVSLTSDPINEVEVAYEILHSLNLPTNKVKTEVVSCPTCGRCDVDIESLSQKVLERLKDYKSDIKVAVMGCVVNGPGEAKDADVGIAGGKSKGIVFSKGHILKTVPTGQLLDELFKEIDKIER
ncbi:flavodoxin-dependent (E)-4-hydroxy-3-methylbut-2-enyl-diphosphate synthase [Proteinivorax hydrogeniformans]|uniref:4-hydroxy-3-methylbut-2-en-1-yl diphosphate synthase (flavodoxin) n=1 Tax=Proteinivorax hydrogeniformans TaxID=1826727 RepID=A0AAU8HXA7_9FIRM